MSFLTETAVPVTFRPFRSIGGFTATVTIEESVSDDLEITSHPVQRGANITDHAYKKPVELNIRAMWSDALAPLSETYSKLLELQATREPFDVVTGKRAYRNMLFKSLANTTDMYTENCLSITATLQQIIIVDVVTATLPARSLQKTPAKTGTTQNVGQKSATAADQGKKSALVSLIGG